MSTPAKRKDRNVVSTASTSTIRKRRPASGRAAAGVLSRLIQRHGTVLGVEPTAGRLSSSGRSRSTCASTAGLCAQSSGAPSARFWSHRTPSKSTMPAQSRSWTPYLDSPLRRGRWRTSTEETVPPCICTNAGRNRCMWSKRGRARNISRRKSLIPQPMSGAPPPTSDWKATFASFEDRRLTQGSLRRRRHPMTIAGVGARAAARNKTGMSAGSFCPSPSRVTTHSPRAARTPERIAALCPRGRSCLTIRARGNRLTTVCSLPVLPSTLPSSTQIISNRRSASARCTAKTSGSMLSRSSRIGTTTEITVATIGRLYEETLKRTASTVGRRNPPRVGLGIGSSNEAVPHPMSRTFIPGFKRRPRAW